MRPRWNYFQGDLYPALKQGLLFFGSRRLRAATLFFFAAAC